MYCTEGSLLVFRAIFNDSVGICVGILELVFEQVYGCIKLSAGFQELLRGSECYKASCTRYVTLGVPGLKPLCL